MGSKRKAHWECPYCGDIAPYGDERHTWLQAHESVGHRLRYTTAYLVARGLYGAARAFTWPLRVRR